MVARKVNAAAILGVFAALAILSFLGNRRLSAVFIAVAGTVLARQASSLCPRCSNLACGFNPRSRRVDAQPVHDGTEAAFSDLPITHTTAIPLLAAEPLALVAGWQFSPPATVVVAATALAANHTLRRLTCSHCGNDCIANCNGRYREWKRTRKLSMG